MEQQINYKVNEIITKLHNKGHFTQDENVEELQGRMFPIKRRLVSLDTFALGLVLGGQTIGTLGLMTAAAYSSDNSLVSHDYNAAFGGAIGFLLGLSMAGLGIYIGNREAERGLN